MYPYIIIITEYVLSGVDAAGSLAGTRLQREIRSGQPSRAGIGINTEK